MRGIFFLTPFLTFAPRKTVKKLALRSKPDKKVRTSGKLGNLKKTIQNHAASPKSLIRGGETNLTSLRQCWDFFFNSHSTYGTWKNGQKVTFQSKRGGQNMENTSGIGKNPVENVSHVPNHIVKPTERI